MSSATERRPEPTISIVLPTYNRAPFLKQAFTSVRSQTFTDWELIVVDDGSTDGTRQLTARLAEDLPQRCHYVFQENQGAYGARNTGLNLARGKYVAFFDSDDLWLPHHLQNCAEALNANRDVDWVFGACQMVEHRTGHELAPTTFYTNGKPRPFLKLRHTKIGKLHIIQDGNVLRCALTHGLFCGLQNSVFRRSLMEGKRFETSRRNEAEDQIIVAKALSEGAKFAYFDDIHVVYRVHDSNSSASAVGQSAAKQKRIMWALVLGFEDLRSQLNLSRAELLALNRRLSREYFWRLGYAILWQNGDRREALTVFRRGMRLWPWNPSYWKTYLVSLAKASFQNHSANQN